jgi:hypothetical protein
MGINKLQLLYTSLYNYSLYLCSSGTLLRNFFTLLYTLTHNVTHPGMDLEL